MSVIGKMVNRRSEIPMNMVTKVKESKRDYNRKRNKSELKRSVSNGRHDD